MRPIAGLICSTLAIAAAACAPTAQQVAPSAAPVLPAPTAAPAPKLGVFFEQYDDAQLALSPQAKAYRGIRDGDYGKWNDRSDAGAQRREQLLQNYVLEIRSIYDGVPLRASDALSLRLFEAMAERSARTHKYRENVYLFNQMRGAQSQLPAFLINIHRVDTVEHAEAYVSRIDGMGEVIDT
ncbi:MAG: DUF885 family protein, partial [Pseudomonadota bacterium]